MDKIYGNDIDGVLASFTNGFLARAKEIGVHDKLPASREEWRGWMTPDQDTFNLVWKTVESDVDFWYGLPLEPHVDQSVIDSIRPDFYVTARPIGSNITERWLRKHGFPVAPVITTPVHSNKVDVLRHYGVTHFVDDKVSTFYALNDAGIHCNLFTTPANEDEDLREEYAHLRIDKLQDFYKKDED